MKDLFETEEILRETYLSYLRSPFRLRHPAVAAERDELLTREGSLYQPLYLEFTPAYKLSGQSPSEVATEIGAPAAIGGLLESGLFPKSRQLYEHQKQAWKASREGRSVVVTSGTGSGKTECFLAPLLASIGEEMIRDGESAGRAIPAQCFWRAPNARRADQRPQSLLHRPAAVRGLVMYPLNALVEDQLARLREACDRPEARAWFDSHAGGDRIWFGRYTGQTPVSGEENDHSRNRLRDELRGMDRDWTAAVQSYQPGAENDPRRFFQDPEGSEMWSRWDMQTAPPDILITNYSMLNIMLMRDLESNIWAQTKQWLESDPRNVFHLVIDELHSYRGTAGSEVAFLLRTLLARIGVSPDSPQVRVLATSASIEENEESRVFLAEFFGRDKLDFEIVPGESVQFSESEKWRDANEAFSSMDTSDLGLVTQALGMRDGTDRSTLASYLDNIGLVAAVNKAVTRTEGGRDQRFTVTARELAERLNLNLASTRGIVRALAAARMDGRTPLSIRGHLFFHAYGRLWACSNPSCTAVVQDDSRRIGKLYDNPVPTCSCGARVLELLICQQCGEQLLGGYVQEKTDEDDNVRTFLSPDFPDFVGAPDKKVEFDPGYEGYRIFWPSGPGAKVSRRLPQPKRDGSVSWQEDTVPRTWRRAGFHCRSSELDETGVADCGFENGFTYVVDIPTPPPPKRPSAFPSTCPHCGHSWARRRQYKNLIRRFSGGFARSAQVLAATLLEISSENDRRTIVFTDSRSDAARLSTSVKMAHYKELLRTVASRELSRTIARQKEIDRQRASWSEIARRAQDLWDDNQLEARNLLDDYLPETQSKVMRDFLRGLADKPAFLENAPLAQWGYCTLRDMREAIFRHFIELGMNPGGPLPSMQGLQASLWWRLLDGSSQFIVPTPDQSEQRELISRITTEFRETLVRTGLQASSHRDFESLGFGFLWLPSDFCGDQVQDQATASVIRILVEKNRWDDDALTEQHDNFPREATSYLEAVDAARGVPAGTTASEVRNRLGQELQAHRLLINRLVFCVPLRSAVELSLHVCARCGARHLHSSAGVCWICNERLEEVPSRAANDEDFEDYRANYYRLLVRQHRGNFPFASFELTGQTTSEARRSRQRRFQDVFLSPDENRRFERVSLLSVTTTMEAGVDIGSLRSVVLGNMPPVRFNYQQRVGRCGRRGTDFSVAVTLSRGRSHDDYYFAQPRAISSDRTPAPFLDVNNESIALRVLRKEVLLRAFLGNTRAGLAASDNDIHGPFGETINWPTVRSSIESWISRNKEAIREIVRRQVSGTSLNVEALSSQIIANLISEIDTVTADPTAQEDQLGRHLAYRGLFPMFGFPTRVRYLYLGGLNTEDSVDREMERAIGSFAPGSQVVWEDKLFTAIGCEHRIPRGRGRMERTPEPLGPTSAIGLCKRCLSVTEELGRAQCSFCGSDDPEDYREIEMCQPRGFVARGDLATDYRERFEFSPTALTARLAPVAEGAAVIGNARLSRGSSSLYRVNDNSGKLFSFMKKRGEEVWFTQDAEKLALESLSGTNTAGQRWADIEDQRTLAIGQISAAVSTIVSIADDAKRLSHLNLSLTSAEGRSAWLSAAYLLQRAAGAFLDVDPEEFVVGVQESTTAACGQIFITDKLENGSGYTQRISQPAIFQEILAQLDTGAPDSMGQFLQGPVHESNCATACYRCLMTYGNSRTHPLLDWRLGLDTIRLLADGSLPTMTTPYWDRYRVVEGSDVLRLLHSIYLNFNLQVDQHDEFPVVTFDGAEPLVIHHPLVASDAPALTARLAQFPNPRPISLFRLIRAPWSVFFAD